MLQLNYENYETILVKKFENKTVEIILNRPQKLNSMTDLFFTEIGHAFEQFNNDTQINAILLWAEGKLFTAGLDLQEASSTSSNDDSLPPALQNLQLYKHIKKWQSNITAISNCKKPVVAAIHSHCIGGGVDLITACDFRFCSADATFSIKETKLGIVADLGTLQRITRVVGPGMARELAFTAESISSQRALSCGLVNQVFGDKETLLKHSRAIVNAIAQNSPLVVQGTKIVLNYADEHSVSDGLEQVALWNSAFLRSDDLNEAFMSFFEKRNPKFKNTL
eukprot:TRINITY_DN650_c1_g1_i1.p1 TRINITY_DN650_c1_g1~~TRINITY_DN650_c1_g1_i1.p1  ORF type:complete len:313 (-),score=139.26 TRINITY_DN650_c1_g1_i1:66-905(-)